jgi:phosphatidate cytidylyltransferase
VTEERLFGWRHAFDHPVTGWITGGIGGVLILSILIIGLLSVTGKIQDPLRKELWKRTLAWAVMAPLVIVPILLGAAWTMGMVLVLSLASYREYARATGLFREKLISIVVVFGIALLSFSILDHWYGFFVALFPLCVGLIAVSTIFLDRPKGYLQRVALGVLGFMLFGSALGHLGYMANSGDYRPIVLLLIAGVQMNDVFAFVCGKVFGRSKLLPNTSPNKTLGGHLGAFLITTPLVALGAHFVFAEEPLDHPALLLVLGAIVSVTGQLGDLMLSSIKRDLGLKDMAATIPGHGGVLDRVNSLLLAAPAVFHYVGFFIGFGLDQPKRIITGP